MAKALGRNDNQNVGMITEILAPEGLATARRSVVRTGATHRPQACRRFGRSSAILVIAVRRLKCQVAMAKMFAEAAPISGKASPARHVAGASDR